MYDAFLKPHLEKVYIYSHPYTSTHPHVRTYIHTYINTFSFYFLIIYCISVTYNLHIYMYSIYNLH